MSGKEKKLFDVRIFYVNSESLEPHLCESQIESEPGKFEEYLRLRVSDLRKSMFIPEDARIVSMTLSERIFSVNEDEFHSWYYEL